MFSLTKGEERSATTTTHVQEATPTLKRLGACPDYAATAPSVQRAPTPGTAETPTLKRLGACPDYARQASSAQVASSTVIVPAARRGACQLYVATASSALSAIFVPTAQATRTHGACPICAPTAPSVHRARPTTSAAHQCPPPPLDRRRRGAYLLNAVRPHSAHHHRPHCTSTASQHHLTGEASFQQTHWMAISIHFTAPGPSAQSSR